MSNPLDDMNPYVQALYDEQVVAWSKFDEHESCQTCGAHVREFSQILHFRWHNATGQDVEAR